MPSSGEIFLMKDSPDVVPSIGGDPLYLLGPSSSEGHIIPENREILALQMEKVGIPVRYVNVMDFGVSCRVEIYKVRNKYASASIN